VEKGSQVERKGFNDQPFPTAFGGHLSLRERKLLLRSSKHLFQTSSIIFKKGLQKNPTFIARMFSSRFSTPEGSHVQCFNFLKRFFGSKLFQQNDKRPRLQRHPFAQQKIERKAGKAALINLNFTLSI
jgi:hypothetical protein